MQSNQQFKCCIACIVHAPQAVSLSAMSFPLSSKMMPRNNADGRSRSYNNEPQLFIAACTTTITIDAMHIIIHDDETERQLSIMFVSKIHKMDKTSNFTRSFVALTSRYFLGLESILWLTITKMPRNPTVSFDHFTFSSFIHSSHHSRLMRLVCRFRYAPYRWA